LQNLGPLWNLKLFIEGLPLPFAGVICDKVMWWVNNLFPASLPQHMMDMGHRYDHHLLVEFADYGGNELTKLENLLQKFVAAQPAGEMECHICETPQEALRATLFRFAVQPAHRTYCVGTGLQGLIIDYAMPKNFTRHPQLPETQYPVEKRFLCSHFGCNVFHESLVFGPDVDVHEAKVAIQASIEAQGGRLPAEHGHGTDYPAPKDAQARWMRIDPSNTMNPGIGGLPYGKHYQHVGAHACGLAH